jgi:hypothetical protein
MVEQASSLSTTRARSPRHQRPQLPILLIKIHQMHHSLPDLIVKIHERFAIACVHVGAILVTLVST